MKETMANANFSAPAINNQRYSVTDPRVILALTYLIRQHSSSPVFLGSVASRLVIAPAAAAAASTAAAAAASAPTKATTTRS